MSDAGRVLILGYGEMGHAMEYLLRSRHELQIWNRHPVAGLAPVVLAQAAARADFVICCVPVTPLAGLVAQVLPHLSGQAVLLTMAKGLDGQGRPAPRVFADVCDGQREFGVLFGPMIAEEIRAGRPAYAQVGVSHPPVFARIANLYAGSGLSPVHSDDLYGIAWASVLKNVYAMLFGATDALGLGDNARGYLVVAVLAELEAIVRETGGQAGTARQLAGLGDLVTTATSAGSHHRALGAQLVRGESGLQGEGLHTLAMLRRLDLFDESVHPLFLLARQLVEHPAAGCAALRTYLLQPPTT